MLWPDDIDHVLKHFPIPPDYRCQVVEGGGFSGARLGRVTTSAGEFCLRRWPPGTRRERLESIVKVLTHARNAAGPVYHGFNIEPGPILAAHASHFWTLEPWLPGKPLA